MDQDKEIEKLKSQVAELTAQNLKLQRVTPDATPKRHFDWRRFWSWTLIILSAVALIPAALLIWLNRTIIDPSTYIKTVGPVIQQPAVQKAITTEATTQLFSAVNVEQVVSQALPDQAQFLASPIASQVKSQTTNLIGQIVASQQFYNLWINVNKKAQATFVNIAKNSSGDTTIDISDVYKYISSQLQDTKLAPVLNKQLPPKIGDIQVANVPALATIPHLVTQLNTWRWVLLGLTVFLAALAVWLSRLRRRAVIAIGSLWMVATVVTLIAVRIVRNILLNQITDSVNHDAASAIWQTLLHYLYIQLAVMFVAGLAVVIVGWLLGPAKLAVHIRRGSQHYLQTARSWFIHEPSQVPFIVFLQKYRRIFEWGILALTILVLLAFTPLTVALLLLILFLALIVLLIFELLAAPTPESPS